jgi:hypothetical protein
MIYEMLGVLEEVLLVQIAISVVTWESKQSRNRNLLKIEIFGVLSLSLWKMSY